MRTIKFRGKNIETCEWVYGFYTQGGYIREDGTLKARHIIHSDFLYDVQEETVGQFTGLYDKNGKEIYEGDIVEINKEKYAYIAFLLQTMGYCVVFPNYDTSLQFFNSNDLKIIGNIYENKERL